MTDAPHATRPMTAADYDDGYDVRQAAYAVAHPTRDLIVGAVVGAAALWAVPKVLDFATGLITGRTDEFDLEYD